MTALDWKCSIFASGMRDFSDIYPYDDAQTRSALERVCRNPLVFVISKYLFPHEKPGYLRKEMLSAHSTEEFQVNVMRRVVKAVLDRTSDGLEIRGIENLSGLAHFVLVSNHRDIVMDPAIILYSMYGAGLPPTDLCVGSNLLSSSLVEDLMRSNRLVKVYRALPAHEMIEFSRILSSYIRDSVTSGKSCVWIAQREGRAKDGRDRTSQGIVKLFSMSGSGDFVNDFDELSIVPVSISYEYESCDALRTRELYLKQKNGSYTKKRGEDTRSILTGIRGRKGRICLSFCKPLSREELQECAALRGNERFKRLCGIMDERICGSYRLWKTNYMGCDLMNGTCKYLGTEYSQDELDKFKSFCDNKLKKIHGCQDKDGLRKIFYSIYGNPVESI